MSLNIIDFSDGIRPEEIQENFEMLQEQLNRERLGVGGIGIASGFDITPMVDADRFCIQISEASIINDVGEELFVPSTMIEIDPPELYSAYEHCTIQYGNKIVLKHTPYALSRKEPAEYLFSKEPKYSGIYINYPSNNVNVDDYIRVSEINGNVLTVTGAINREVVVRYNYTANRIDTVYLKEDNTIGVLKGTTSTTPSKSYMPADGKLLIAYIMIESKYVGENFTTPAANIYIKEDMRTLRNLYTDSNNDLYICGTLFDDLQIIHLREPRNPKPNALWLNTDTNILYCWKSTDQFVYRNHIIIGTEFEDYPNANRDFATYIDYIIGENELEVYYSKGFGLGKKLINKVHYHELYNEFPASNQNIPADAEGNSFRIIEDKVSGNGLTLERGDKITYVIRFRDSHYMWVPVNATTYITAKDRKVYCTSDYAKDGEVGYFDSPEANGMDEINADADANYYSHKYQYFIFHMQKDANMLFTPNKEELSIYINQMILHRDQFEELTVNDLIDKTIPESVIKNAAINFGWTPEILETYTGDYEYIGIGFKLVDPLDSGFNASIHDYTEEDGSRDLYVEAVVERRVSTGPFNNKSQRTATFITENSVIVDEYIKATGIVQLAEGEYYRYNEHQLEVFHKNDRLKKPSAAYRNAELIEQYGYYLHPISKTVDGQEVITHEEVKVRPISIDAESADYIEWESSNKDQRYFEKKRGCTCSSFKINNRDLAIGDVITYKITTNVYGYTHVRQLVADEIAKLNLDVQDVNELTQRVANHEETVQKQIEDLTVLAESNRSDIDTIKDEKKYFDKDENFSIEYMPKELTDNPIFNLGKINTRINLVNSKVDYDVSLDNIKPNDYLTVVHRLPSRDIFLIPDVDYYVFESNENNLRKYYFHINIDDKEEGNLNELSQGGILIITGIRLRGRGE